MVGRRRLLVPEARDALRAMKDAVIREQGLVAGSHHTSDIEVRTDDVENRVTGLGATVKTDLAPGINTTTEKVITTREAGERGGAVGGEMLRRLIELAKKELDK